MGVSLGMLGFWLSIAKYAGWLGLQKMEIQ